LRISKSWKKNIENLVDLSIMNPINPNFISGSTIPLPSQTTPEVPSVLLYPLCPKRDLRVWREG
jgi:hypothetical protein